MIHRGFFIEALLGSFSLFFLNYSVLRIRDILVQIRIQILGSVPLANGIGYGRSINKHTDPDPDPDADPEHWYIYIILHR
jgi:hypothetical protein